MPLAWQSLEGVEAIHRIGRHALGEETKRSTEANAEFDDRPGVRRERKP
jgi:hypothetical protein